jgi:hypothetical protein
MQGTLGEERLQPSYPLDLRALIDREGLGRDVLW